MFRPLSLAVLFVIASFSARGQAQTCMQFEAGMHHPGADAAFVCSTIHDDGSGPALYVGGRFHTIAGVLSPGIVRWDGTTWTDVGGGLGPVNTLQPVVSALLSYQGRLYVGGKFTTAGGVPAANLATWDGTSWSAVPGAPDDHVTALATYQGALVVGGRFQHAGGATLKFVANYSPSTGAWSQLGEGLDYGPVLCLATYTGSQGTSLFVGGGEMKSASTAFSTLLRWNGTAWSNAGTITGNLGERQVRTMLVVDEPGGSTLWIGGHFYSVDGLDTRCLARWDGSVWSRLGMGGVNTTGPHQPYTSTVSALARHDDGTGPAVYVAGDFLGVDGLGPHLVRYRGGAFHALPSVPNARLAGLASFAGQLLVGGDHTNVAGVRAPGVVSWHSNAWHPICAGLAPGGRAEGLCSYDDGSGLALYGTFDLAVGFLAPTTKFARWANGVWTDVPPPSVTQTSLGHLLVHDDGSGAGPSLYVTGAMEDVQGTSYPGIARWNASGWSTLAPFPIDPQTYVYGLARFDEGAGPRLFACGNFNAIGGVSASRIARWDGSTWTTLGAGLDQLAQDMCVHDDGTGPALYVTGQFSHAGGIPAAGIARWNGTSWSALGSGLSIGFGSIVGSSVVSYDDGAGPALYVGGSFTHAGGVPASNVARWRNGVWSDVGGGVLGANLSAMAWHLAVHDDGRGPALYVGGDITSAGGVPVRSLARWNGHAWDDVYGGLSAPPASGPPGIIPSAFAVHDDGDGPTLWIGGGFGASGGVVANGVTRLCPVKGIVLCSGDGSDASCPCGNVSPSDLGLGCLNSLGTGGQLRSTGTARVSADTVELVGTGMTSSSCLYLQGTLGAAHGAGIPFGDGLRCVSGSVVRLGTLSNVNGGSVFPPIGSSQTVSALGSVPAGATRVYQCWYRNAAAFCTSSTFNFTNGWQVTWSL